LREEELAMIVMPASRLDGRLAGGIHEVAVASKSMRKRIQATPNAC
jgi:hypothetical protein